MCPGECVKDGVCPGECVRDSVCPGVCPGECVRDGVCPGVRLTCGFCPGTPRMEVPEEVECAPSPHLALVLKVAGLGTTREVELPLANYKATIFCYVQKLLQLSCSGAVKTDKLRRIWEPTYT